MIPKTLYHATDRKHLGSILTEGLKSQCEGVYFSDTPANAAKFVYLHGVPLEDIIAIPVKTKKLYETHLMESCDHDERFFQCKAWVYEKSVPSECLEASKILKFTEKS